MNENEIDSQSPLDVMIDLFGFYQRTLNMINAIISDKYNYSITTSEAVVLLASILSGAELYAAKRVGKMKCGALQEVVKLTPEAEQNALNKMLTNIRAIAATTEKMNENTLH